MVNLRFVTMWRKIDRKKPAIATSKYNANIEELTKEALDHAREYQQGIGEARELYRVIGRNPEDPKTPSHVFVIISREQIDSVRSSTRLLRTRSYNKISGQIPRCWLVALKV